MTTTAAGDAAVARLNKATEAFEKIITGASNQVVDVPGYGNQPTLAGRVDQRLDETTATAAAEANRSRDEADRSTTQANAAANSVTLSTAEHNKAKTQADRAQYEADRAAQITGLETVADAIGMAALPLPDVWAPLSDSLRLITGYGRDVLVGSDVVARMVNFSRSTTKTYLAKDGAIKVAAVNEPAFEDEGLLIEGASSNLISTSTAFKGAVAGVSYEAVNNPSFPHSITRVLKPSGNGDVWTNNAELLAGTVYTASIYIDKNTQDPSVKVYYGTNSIATNLVRSGVVIGGLERYTATFTCLVSGPHQIRFGAYGAAFDFVAGCPQIEPLPFASSYIPTNGAAATRAQDLAWLPAYGNEPFGLVMSIAAEVDLIGKGLSSWPRPYELNDSENKGGHIVMASGSLDGADLVGRKTTIALRFSDRSYWASGAKRPSQWNEYLNQLYTGNIYLFGTATPARVFYGHVRNIRVWFVQLSDDQHKAIK